MEYKQCPRCGNDKPNTGVYECTKCRKPHCAKCGANKKIHTCKGASEGGIVLGVIRPNG